MSDDLIRRQAVLEQINGWLGYELKDMTNPIYYLEKRIKALPSVTPTERAGHWIPVSERLPEEREWYLAVFKEKDTDFQLIPRVADYIGSGKNKWRMIDENGLTQEYLDLLECVAWMPLPAPYEGSDTE